MFLLVSTDTFAV